MLEETKSTCKVKDKEVKHSEREARRAFIYKNANMAERVAQHGEINTAYKVTNQLCGSYASQTRQGTAFHLKGNRQKDGFNIFKRY